MKQVGRRLALRAGLAGCVLALVLAAPAWAGTIRYTVDERADYTIQDNGNGIVKVLWRECVTAGEPVSVAFDVIANVTRQDGFANFSVLREEGTDPSVRFDIGADGTFDDPPRLFLERGRDNVSRVAISFSLPSPNDGVNTFRIKLDPDSGEGLGQGAGIMVRIPCVLAPPPPPPEPGQQGGGQQPAPLTAPTEGTLPAPSSPQARGEARCVATPRRVRARVGERFVLRVRVIAGQTRIQNALVRVSGAGVRMERMTDANGVATFFIRPRRRGTLVIQSDVCFGADRLRVLGARRVARRVAPRFTG